MPVRYATQIEEEIVRLTKRLDDLRTALRVLNSLQSEDEQPEGKPGKPGKAKRRSRYPTGGEQRAREALLKVFGEANRPMRAYEFLPVVMGLANVGECTVWGALKALRAEGLTTWDAVNRTHALASPAVLKEKAS